MSINTDNLDLTAEEREELEDVISPNGGIAYKSQDIDVAGLVNRINKGDIIIPRIGLGDPNLEMNEFQRGFVWSKKQMDSFIESLLLEYPVPNLFMVQQSDRRLIVLDGQQRLETLRRFYSGITNERKFRLNVGGSRFSGLSYDELSDRDRRILDNTYITSTVISMTAAESSREAVYDVFARLNSGGTQLTPHEIRMALFNGGLMQRIDESNRRECWRALYGSSEPNKRFRDHELVLRIVAFFIRGDTYSKPLGGFLNDFSADYRDGDDNAIINALALFDASSEVVRSSGVIKPFSIDGKGQINNARAEAIMVNIMKGLSAGVTIDSNRIRQMIGVLNQDEVFNEAITRSTSDETQVRDRLACAKAALFDV